MAGLLYRLALAVDHFPLPYKLPFMPRAYHIQSRMPITLSHLGVRHRLALQLPGAHTQMRPSTLLDDRRLGADLYVCPQARYNMLMDTHRNSQKKAGQRKNPADTSKK